MSAARRAPRRSRLARRGSRLARRAPLGRARVALALCLLAACADRDPVEYPAGPLARAILDFADPAALGARNQAQLPAGYDGAQTCSSDPTRAFLGELADHGPDDVKVPFHWAPAVPGPLAGKGPVQQPEFYAAGVVSGVNHSALDTSFDHVFGFDFNMDVVMDPPFRSLVKTRDPGETALHTEIEVGIFPEAAFGFAPASGDRVVMKGAWIWDCGHPPVETEMHPPTFLAFARQADATTTVSLAFVAPYRGAQLFGPVAAVADFASPGRFADSGLPFPQAFVAEVIAAAATGKDHLEAHELLEAMTFDTLSWSVCAPSPRPAHAALRYTHRFATRTGVTLTALPSDATGCVGYTATMTSAYRPMVPTRGERQWPWSEISQQASDESGINLDVRQRIVDAFRARGLGTDIPALRADHPPVIDRYDTLRPSAGAAEDAPLAITSGADAQPYPFHGRARVYWQ